MATTKSLDDQTEELVEQSRRKTMVVPKPRPAIVEGFVGREDILNFMCQTHFGNLDPQHEGPMVTVLTAAGGSGKTQIAVKFASIFEEKFHDAPIFFVNASSEKSLRHDLGALVQSQADGCADALAWLAHGLENWLLIMDNADDRSFDLSLFLPRAPHGHVVITTRDTTWKAFDPRSTHVVGPLSSENSVVLLLNSSGCEDNEANRSFAKDIADKLGKLPLALAFAAAYIRANNPIYNFLKIYNENRSRSLQRTPDLQNEHHSYSLEGIIELSFGSLSPRVQEMIQLLVRLDARLIPRCIIEKAAERMFLHIPQKTDVSPCVETLTQAEVLQSIFHPSGNRNAQEFDEMIEECLKYSLLQLSTANGEHFYSMHPLVQGYLRSISSFVRGCFADRLIARLLASATTKGARYEFFAFNQLLVPHISILQMENITEPGDHFGFGSILLELESDLSMIHLERSLDMWKTSAGDDAFTTLEVEMELGNAYVAFGKPEKALPLHEEVFQKWKESLGPDHIDTLRAMTNLANTYNRLGRQTEALPIQEEALDRLEKSLGIYHIHTLGAMYNLAHTYRSLGRAKEAVPLQREVLQKRRELLGLDHRHTLHGMQDLALTYGLLARDEEAIPLLEEVTERLTKLLGPEHRETMNAMYNLLLVFYRLRMWEKLKTLANTALPSHEKVYGLEDQKTMWIRNVLK